MSLFINDKELNNTLRELQAAYTVQTDSLLAANAALQAKLQELIDEKQLEDVARASAVVTYFGSQMSGLSALCEKLDNTALLLSKTAENMPQLPQGIVPAVNAVNKMTDKLSVLQKTIVKTLNDNSGVAIEKFDKITAALENSINKTWTNIEETLTRNAKELFETYERFFDLCSILVKQLPAAAQNPKKEAADE